MRVSAAAKVLRSELDRASKRGAGFVADLSDAFFKDLNFLISQECHLSCRAGGGSSSICKISTCCREKKYIGCWECPSFENCDKLKEQFIEHCRDINRLGIDKYIQTYQ